MVPDCSGLCVAIHAAIWRAACLADCSHRVVRVTGAQADGCQTCVAIRGDQHACDDVHVLERMYAQTSGKPCSGWVLMMPWSSSSPGNDTAFANCRRCCAPAWSIAMSLHG